MLGMNYLFFQIKEYRKKIGLSQQALAAKAGLSLATVQNIESGRSNPEWTTLSALLETLGLTFDLQPKSIDWDIMASYGCPLMGFRENDINLTREGLIRQINQVGLHIDDIDPESRESFSFHAFLSAIESHYPSVWVKLSKPIRIWFSSQKTPGSIKLRRLALQKLGAYL